MKYHAVKKNLIIKSRKTYIYSKLFERLIDKIEFKWKGRIAYWFKAQKLDVL